MTSSHRSSQSPTYNSYVCKSNAGSLFCFKYKLKSWCHSPTAVICFVLIVKKMISVTYNVMFEKVDKAENLFCLNLSKKSWCYSPTTVICFVLIVSKKDDISYLQRHVWKSRQSREFVLFKFKFKKLMLLTYNRHVCKLHESIIARCHRHLAQIGSRVLNLITLGKVLDENFSKNLVYFVPENVQNRKRSWLKMNWFCTELIEF